MSTPANFIIDIGGNGTHINPSHPHGINQDILDGGWKKFIDDNVWPEVNWALASGKIPRIQLYSPFSDMDTTGPGGLTGPQFDQYLHAREASLPTVTDFGKAWAEIVAVAQVDCYLGHLDDYEFARRASVQKRKDNWIDRFMLSIKPIANAGMSIVVDSFTDFAEDSLEYRGLHLASLALARPPKLEGWPRASRTHLHGYDFVFIQSTWANAPGNPVNATLNQLTGEIVRWGDAVVGGGDTQAQKAAKFADYATGVQNDGQTPLIPSSHLRLEGYTASTWA